MCSLCYIMSENSDEINMTNVYIGIGIGVFLLFLVIGFIWWRWRKRPHMVSTTSEHNATPRNFFKRRSQVSLQLLKGRNILDP
jgi:hypothetical protein